MPLWPQCNRCLVLTLKYFVPLPLVSCNHKRVCGPTVSVVRRFLWSSTSRLVASIYNTTACRITLIPKSWRAHHKTENRWHSGLAQYGSNPQWIRLKPTLSATGRVSVNVKMDAFICVRKNVQKRPFFWAWSSYAMGYIQYSRPGRKYTCMSSFWTLTGSLSRGPAL